ncbi:MAG: YraN family protein [Patescibacteria group bacterium]
MPSEKRQKGDVGEKIAREYLQRKGYRIIEQNYLKPWGEIDIVATKNQKLIFCEVKTRSAVSASVDFLPEHNITAAKRRNLRRICETYCRERRLMPEQEWQIDVISVIFDEQQQKARVQHFENAVWEKQY